MKIVFMGTPDFAAIILDNVVNLHEVVAVYTRPDAVRGRGKTKVPSPVRVVAEKAGIPVETPRSLKDPSVLECLRSYQPDVICVAAYGMILPREVLAIPPYGCINIHASLLPSWRGAAPIERAILADDKETGVCVMRMEEGLDMGDYCICRKTQLEEKTATALSDELANLGSNALLTALIHIQENEVEWNKQDDSLATYAHKIERHELDLTLKDKTRTMILKVRASSPAHPSRCIIGERPVTLILLREVKGDVSVQEVTNKLLPGHVLYYQKRLFLGAADGAVEVRKVKPDGKQAMEAQSFAAGIQGIKNRELTWTELHA